MKILKVKARGWYRNGAFVRNKPPCALQWAHLTSVAHPYMLSWFLGLLRLVKCFCLFSLLDTGLQVTVMFSTYFIGLFLKSLLQILLNQQQIVVIDSVESSLISYELTNLSALSFQICWINNNLFPSYTKKILADKLFLSFLQKSHQWWIMRFFSGTWKVKLLLKKPDNMQLFCWESTIQ